MNDIIKEYNSVSNKLKIRRKKYLWQWVVKAFKITTILNKDNKYYKNSIQIKFFGVLLIVLLDDIAENLQDKKLLDTASKIVKEEFNYFIKTNKTKEKTVLTNFHPFSTAELNYLYFTQKVTQQMLTNVSCLPNYNILKKEFYKYWREAINCFNFTLYANNVIKNRKESKIKRYFNNLSYSYYTNTTGHNMHVILAMIIDLMCLRKVDKKNIKLSIKIAGEAQSMGRIGNWLSTWKREIVEKDFSSGVAIYSIANKNIDVKDVKQYVKKSNKTLVQKLIKQIGKSDFENYFLGKWEKHKQKMEIISNKIKGFPANKYLKGTELFLKLHLENENKI